MSDIIKAAQADASQVQTTAAADLAKAEAAARGAVGAVAADAGKFAGQATAGIGALEATSQGWLRRNVWGVLGAAVMLAVVAVLALRFG